jgi:hypothetical protein
VSVSDGSWFFLEQNGRVEALILFTLVEEGIRSALYHNAISECVMTQCKKKKDTAHDLHLLFIVANIVWGGRTLLRSLFLSDVQPTCLRTLTKIVGAPPSFLATRIKIEYIAQREPGL